MSKKSQTKSLYLDTIFAGFGGQGVMLIGHCLTAAAMQAGLNTTYMPVYGVEMRGGTANCTVVVSERPVGSPVIYEPLSAVVMNRPSAEKFSPLVKPRGLLLVNSSLVEEQYVKTRAKRVMMIPALQLAQEVGNPRLANMILLGSLVQATGVVSVEQVAKSLTKALDVRYHKMIPINTAALERGAAFVQESQG